MNEVIKNNLKSLGFEAEVMLADSGLCPFCFTAIDPANFKDELSVAEYHISGLCQACQDTTFNEDGSFKED